MEVGVNERAFLIGYPSVALSFRPSTCWPFARPSSAQRIGASAIYGLFTLRQWKHGNLHSQSA